MNDKIEISTKDYEIEQSLFQSNFTNRTIEFLKENNVDELLDRAYNSNDKLYCNIKTVNCTINPYGLQIAFNPNRLSNTKPTELLTYESFKDSFELIEQELVQIGIKLNLSKQPIYRFHSSFDVATDYTFDEYMSLIRAFLPHKAKLRYNETFSIENTLYKLLSKQQKIVVYDKMKLYNELNPGAPLPSEVMRFEYRNEKQSKEKRFSLLTLSKDRYYKLRLEHKQVIRDNIFHQSEVIADSLLSLLLALLSNKVRNNEIYKYVSSYSINNELKSSNLDLVELLKSFADKENHSYQKAIRRFINTINTYSTFDGKLNKDLYTELSYKFSKVA